MSMVPNNNFSVLPWYRSLQEQNARKWWAYGEIYPLFAPALKLLPFQVIRDSLRTAIYEKGSALSILDNAPGSQMNVLEGTLVLTSGTPVDCTVTQYDCFGESVIYLEDVPIGPGREGYAACNIVFCEQTDHVLSYFNISGFTGAIEVPEGATSVWIQSINSDDPDKSGGAYEATFIRFDVTPISIFKIYTASGELVGDYINEINDAGLEIKTFVDPNCDIIVFPAILPFVQTFSNGQYYVEMSDGTNTWYSEVFTAVNDTEPYLKIEWWDDSDFYMDAGIIVYTSPAFKNTIYLPSDLAKPEYEFEEEGENRDGYFFPIKQISQKLYHFRFLAPEYLLDVIRFIRMSDHILITYRGRTYVPDTFLVTPEWEGNGDIANVEAEFTTYTVAKKIGLGYLRAQRGDFNQDFNPDYDI